MPGPTVPGPSAPGTATREPPVWATTAADGHRPAPSAWVGWVGFAGVVMALVGGFHAFVGFVALFDPGYFLVTRSGLAMEIDYTAWGWVHLILGVLVAVAGISLFAGKLWARAVTIALAVLVGLVNLAFIAAYPLWSIIALALAVTVIYAVAVHGGEMASKG